MRFLLEIGDVAVTSQADVNAFVLGKSRLAAGVRIVAVGAISGRARMRHLGALDQLGLIVMAGHTK